MTAIGGFFELELPRGGAPYHAGARALASGRACLRRILDILRPARVWAPFYICDAVLPAIEHAGAAVEFYGVDECLDPQLGPGQVGAADVVLYVNYFGIKSSTAAAAAAAYGRRAVIDDTQAFFQKGYAGASSFNSARKFFGVPDGGYAYGAGIDAMPVRPSTHVRYDHLITRLLGHGELAFEQYRESERCVDDELAAMSPLTARLLAAVDYEAARRRREENFRQLHERLGARNRLHVADDAAASGAFCYPLLLGAPVAWQQFWDRKIFVPRLWPEIETRADASRFERERRLAACLVPLPIDQRYAADEMDRVAAAVEEIARW